MTLQIIGAGMAGLLSAEMLRREQPTIYEAQPTLPDNHGALLRFRSDVVERETHQKFRRVRVLKSVFSHGSLYTTVTLRDLNQYSYKVAGSVAARSVLTLEPADRWIAPPGFLGELARDAKLVMNSRFNWSNLNDLRKQRDIVTISTIPMPVLMKIAQWPSVAEDFEYRPITSVNVTIVQPRVDVFQTIYYPDPGVPYYRASLTGDRLTIEYAGDVLGGPQDLISITSDFGLPADCVYNKPIIKSQQYGKLLSANETERHAFITAMTDEYNVYSVGRFATWRQILLDDVVHDVRVVERMWQQRSIYLSRLAGAR